jgi:predicted nucleotidyltransferase
MKPLKEGWWFWPPIVLSRYWFLQGTLYMNWAERCHRWLLELVFFSFTYLIVSSSAGYPVGIICSFLIAHTISALLNGHLFALLSHDLFWFSLYKDKSKFISYIDGIRSRMQQKNPRFICGTVFFGSLVRGIFRDSSDLDIRIIAENGFWNAFRAANLVFLERVRAFFTGFPIDIYMIRNKDELYRKMDVKNETPVCVYRYGDKLRQLMPEFKSFDSFKSTFLSSDEGQNR